MVIELDVADIGVRRCQRAHVLHRHRRDGSGRQRDSSGHAAAHVKHPKGVGLARHRRKQALVEYRRITVADSSAVDAHKRDAARQAVCCSGGAGLRIGN